MDMDRIVGRNDEKVSVAVRIRPLIQRERDDQACNHWYSDKSIIQQYQSNGKDLISNHPPYNFDFIFNDKDDTSVVYKNVVAKIVENAFLGFNGTVLCYGQTSSGKTFTLYGTDSERGIISLTAEHLFKKIKDDVSRTYYIRIGLLEVYNEKVTDLLNNRAPVEIKEINGSVVPKGHTELEILSADEMLNAAKIVQNERKIGETRMNKESSRSHTILRILIESVPNDGNDNEDIENEFPSQEVQVTNALLNFVDLAGSEKASQTGAVGERFKESTFINKSLSTLSQVVHQLCASNNTSSSRGSNLSINFTDPPGSQKQTSKYINYRDSKLTRILQSSLSGNAFIALICNITPAAIEESHSTLRFARTAKKVKLVPIKNQGPADGAQFRTKIVELESRLVGKTVEADTLKNKIMTMPRFYQPQQRLTADAQTETYFKETPGDTTIILEASKITEKKLLIEMEHNQMLLKEWEREKSFMQHEQDVALEEKDDTMQCLLHQIVDLKSQLYLKTNELMENSQNLKQIQDEKANIEEELFQSKSELGNMNNYLQETVKQMEMETKETDEERVTAFKSKMELMKTAKTDCEKTNQKLSSEIINLKAGMKQKEEEIEKLFKENKRWKQNVESFVTAETEQLELRGKKLLQQSNDERNKAFDENLKLKQQIALLQDRLVKEGNQMKQKWQDLLAQVKKHQANISCSVSTIAALSADNSKLKEDIAKLNEVKASLSSAKSNLMAEIKKLKLKLHASDGENTEYQKVIADLKKELLELKQHHRQLQEASAKEIPTTGWGRKSISQNFNQQVMIDSDSGANSSSSFNDSVQIIDEVDSSASRPWRQHHQHRDSLEEVSPIGNTFSNISDPLIRANFIYCKVCKKVIPKKSALRHKKTHRPPKSCPKCGKRYKTDFYYNIHVANCNNYYPY